jgi:hypothetical protein
MPETPVVESPAISAADMTSTAGGAGAMAVSDTDKAGTSAPPATGGEGGDLCTTGPQPAPGLPAMEEGTRSEDDRHWCLYVGTSWVVEVIVDRRDVEEFKEVSRMIEPLLSVRALADSLEFLALGHPVMQGLIAFLLV